MQQVDAVSQKKLQDLADYLVDLVRKSMTKDVERKSA